MDRRQPVNPTYTAASVSPQRYGETPAYQQAQQPMPLNPTYTAAAVSPQRYGETPAFLPTFQQFIAQRQMAPVVIPGGGGPYNVPVYRDPRYQNAMQIDFGGVGGGPIANSANYPVGVRIEEDGGYMPR